MAHRLSTQLRCREPWKPLDDLTSQSSFDVEAALAAQSEVLPKPSEQPQLSDPENYESGFVPKESLKPLEYAKFARFSSLTAENPHSLQQGTNRHNFTQLQAPQNKATCNKVFQALPIRPKLFHVEQFGLAAQCKRGSPLAIPRLPTPKR